MASEHTVVEQGKPLSQCALWQYQRDYFAEQGPKAWDQQVPFHITCNPMIAHQYAASIVRYWQDLIKQGDKNITEPFYIVELGAGSAAFSFHMLKQLDIWLERLGMQEVCWQYVITDFTESNASFWKQNSVFKSFRDRGVLDFAIFNLEFDTQIVLHTNGKKLKRDSTSRPMVVLANYIFDTVSHDVFQIKEDQLKLGITRISCEKANFIEDKHKALSEFQTEFAYQALPHEYFKLPEINEIAKAYQSELSDHKVLIPTGSIEAIERLKDIAGGEILLLSSDKGFCHQLDQYCNHDPDIAFHGSFSLMVNYDAIAKYTRLKQGQSFLQTNSQSLVSGAFLISKQLDKLTETHAALEYFIQQQSPSDLYAGCYSAMSQGNTLDLLNIVTFFKLSHYDPYLLHSVGPVLQSIQNNLLPENKQELCRHLAEMESNIYPMPAHKSLYDWVLELFLNLQDWFNAKILAEKLVVQEPKDYYYWYALGLACYYLEEPEKAKTYFTLSCQYNDKHIPSFGYLEKLAPITDNIEFNRGNVTSLMETKLESIDDTIKSEQASAVSRREV